MTTDNTQALDFPLQVGGRYNWKNQPERLVFMGVEISNGAWYQFAKVDAPGVVWCEVRLADLTMFEKTTDLQPTKAEPQPVIAPSPARHFDSLQMADLWIEFSRSAACQQALEWVQTKDFPGALFVAFRAGCETNTGISPTPAPQPVIAPAQNTGSPLDGHIATVVDNFLTDFSEISRTFQEPIPIGTRLYAKAEQPALPPAWVMLTDDEIKSGVCAPHWRQVGDYPAWRGLNEGSKP